MTERCHKISRHSSQHLEFVQPTSTGKQQLQITFKRNTNLKSYSHVFRQALHVCGMSPPPDSQGCICQLWQALTYDSEQGNPRSTAIRAVAKANKLDLEIVETTPANGVHPDYLKINPLGKVPSFVGGDGYTLTECIAIAIYGMYPVTIRYLGSLFICPCRTMMRHIINYSYPCLNIPVEKF